MTEHTHDYLSGRRIDPRPITGDMSVRQLVDETFLAYNGARLREACQLVAQKMLEPDVTVGLSLTGAMTPAGLGITALIPLLRAGFVDWIVSTGANLYHDLHYGLNLPLHRGTANVDDVALRRAGIIRIYDIFFEYDVLLSTDTFIRETTRAPEFQKRMGTAEFHYLLGKYVAERERVLGLQSKSLVAAAYETGVPLYTSSPGDSSIGMNVAANRLTGSELAFDPERDVNETAAIVWNAKSGGGKSAVVLLGGGSPKNFVLQTEPQIQEVLGLAESGHDYFLQVTDARPDTGGLSGATPGEAVSWGKVDPEQLPDAVVCYLDTTVALPIMTAYALAARPARPLKRLYDKRDALMSALTKAYHERLAAGAPASEMGAHVR